MANPASVTDVEARYWLPLSAQQVSNVEVWLDDAWEILLTRRPTLEQDIADGKVRERNAVRVLASMVTRVLANPEAKSEESIDDYRYRRHELVAAGILHVSDDELGDVTPAAAGRRQSVRLVVYGDD